jgi:hypothetical protein
MKVTVTTTKEIREEIELTLPHYRKTIYGAIYKIASDDEIIKIFNVDGACSIDVNKHYKAVAFSKDTTECSAEEFNETYVIIMKKLNKIKDEVLKDIYDSFLSKEN